MAKRATKAAGAKGSLAEYDAKRDLARSPEPAAKVAARAGRSFCVQKHLASHLHYDLRLEHGGVLLSWAVPKGPSLNPAEKRMAVRVEDHPVAYGDFEGVIPTGYGAGVVMLWDRGTWRPDPQTPDVDAALKNGELKFALDGVKLKGSWVLVRTRGFGGTRESWLLIKHRDRWSGDVDVAAAAPESVKNFGDFDAILVKHGTPAEWAKSPPAKGGDAGAMIREVVARAAALRSGEKPATVKPARARVAKKPAAKATAARPAPSGGDKPKLTNQHKVLFPKTGFTKGDLVDYYRRVAPLILPHLAGRSVSLKRYPDGVEGESFFEKRCNAHRPAWVRTLRVTTNSGKAIDYCAIADARTLVWAANLAAIELHVPLALAAAPDTPTAMVFDLDPGPPATLKHCVPVALRLKGLLDEMKLASVVKTSGGKGLHVLVPLNTPGVTFEDTKAFARAVAMTLQKDDPTRVIASMSRAARAGKVFLDWGQNDREKTTACVFSVRARAEPTVSWPLSWEALDEGTPPRAARADHADERERIARGWKAAMSKRQRLKMPG
jgi:bifunctional non-homologous end joining protein LigD